MQLLVTLNIETIRPIVDVALAAMRKGLATGTPEQMLSCLLIGVQARNAVIAKDEAFVPLADRIAASQVLQHGIERVEDADTLSGQILHGAYVEQMPDGKIGNRHGYSRQRAQSKRIEAHELLAEALLAWEIEARNQLAEEQRGTIPSVDPGTIFGRKKTVSQLVDQLSRDDTAGLVTIVGLGGVGKTLVAQHVVHQIIPKMRFERVIWLTVGQGADNQFQVPPSASFAVFIRTLAEAVGIPDAQTLSASVCLQRLKLHLRQTTYLIIIDNLEVAAQTAYLLTQIHSLTQPTKILMTARSQPPQGLAHNVLLGPLGRADSIALLRSRFATAGQPRLAQLDDAALGPIYELIGGHPLGLQLVANLCLTRALSSVLRDLRQEASQSGAGPQTEAVLERVYARYLSQLGPAALRVLEAMTLVAPPGGDEVQLAAVTQLDEASLWGAVTQLSQLSLLMLRPNSAENMLYAVHSLTNLHMLRAIDATGATARADYAELVARNLAYWQEAASGFTLSHYHAARNQLLRAVQVGLGDSFGQSPATVNAAAALLTQLFRLIEQTGVWEDWAVLYQRALDLLPPTAMDLRYRLMERLGIFRERENTLQNAVDIHEAAAALAETHDDEHALSRAHFVLGWDYLRARKYDLAHRYASAAVDSFVNQGLPAVYLGPAYANLGYVNWARGFYDEAQAQLQKALGHCAVSGDISTASRAACNLGYVETSLAHYAAADARFDEAMRCAEQAQSQVNRTMVRLGQAYSLLERGDAAAVCSLLEGISAEIGQHANHAHHAMFYNFYLGKAYAQQRDSRAAEALERAIQHGDTLGDSFIVAQCYGWLGTVTQNQRRAVAYLESAIALLTDYINRERLAASLMEQFDAVRRTRVNPEDSNDKSP